MPSVNGTTYTSADPNHPLHRLTPEQIDEIGAAFQAIHDEVKADLGERDAHYIRSLIEFHRRLGALARIVLMASRYPPAWLLGTAGLSVAKILENMELGHNILHGQWDWMNDPNIHSSTWDWDTASTSAGWKHSHNYLHHTFTNVVGKDKDVGYEIMRVDPKQKWEPRFLAQPLVNVILMLFFEWGVALHDLDLEAVRAREKSLKDLRKDLKGIRGKMVRQSSRTTSRSRCSAGARASRPRSRRTSPPTSCATCGPTRSSSAGTSPTRPTPSPRTRRPTRAAAPGTSASSSVPPTSTAATRST